MSESVQAAGKDPRVQARDPEGLNWAAPAELLAEDFITPASLFFTRSHAATPQVELEAWRLRVVGLVSRPLELSLAELLAGFPEREVTATLVCAGLRRDELLAVRPIPGELPWGTDPVGTGRWRGVSLADVLMVAGPTKDAAHVGFTGLDSVERLDRRFGFGGSIPLGKALHPEVLLAHRLNDEPLPPEHGFPVRVVVPGYIGARSVKWVTEIELRAEPSTNYFQTHAYRLQREVLEGRTRDVTAGEALGELPLNTVILTPVPGATLAAGPTVVRGWALGPDSRGVALVEVSPDGGRSWVRARITDSDGAWAWVQWEAGLDLAPGDHTIVARAADGNGQLQPADLTLQWNVKGYLNHAWHRVPVRVASVADGGEPR
ncbi:MAG TPA: sulfite oxidase [Gemmatimonadales bacterium]|nr:sulfite oxidase [Gemmatimonadales bacterium]